MTLLRRLLHWILRRPAEAPAADPPSQPAPESAAPAPPPQAPPPAPARAVTATCAAIVLFLNALESAARAPATIAWYTENLARLARIHVLLPTKQTEIEAFTATLSRNPHTRHKFFRALRSFFRFLDARGLHRPNPMAGVLPPKLPKKHPKTLGLPELKQLLTMAKSHRDRAMLIILIDTGIRRGELVNLAWGDLGADFISVTGKTGARTIPILPATVRALWTIKPPGARPLDKIFVSLKTDPRTLTRQPLAPEAITVSIKRYLKAMGLSGGPHTLRHSFGRAFCALGGNAFVLKDLLGHTTLSTTNLYVAMAGAELVDAHQKFSPLSHLEASAGPGKPPRRADPSAAPKPAKRKAV